MLRFAALLLAVLFVSQAHATEAGWALLREGGHVVLLRHANAPGSGEPSSFDITKCATQRNLSDRGRQQAKRMGALFFARAAPVEKVLTSSYCRCNDTARLAFGDSMVENYDALDLLPGDEEANAEKVAMLTQFILAYSDFGNLVMVVNEDVIQSLVGASSREAEAIIVSRGGEDLHVAGRIRFN